MPVLKAIACSLEGHWQNKCILKQVCNIENQGASPSATVNDAQAVGNAQNVEANIGHPVGQVIAVVEELVGFIEIPLCTLPDQLTSKAREAKR